jgi:exodeoxyribonuclease VII small subunit
METTQEHEGEEPRYKEALTELEQILDQIEGGEVDLDDLGAKVERAAQLIQLCRGKIERAEVQVRRIIESLDREAGA